MFLNKKMHLFILGALLSTSSVIFAYDYVGLDSNADGVRDDVYDAWSAIESSSYKKKILLQQAKLMQRIMATDLDDKNNVSKLGTEYMSMMSCLAGVYTVDGEDAKFMQYSRNITDKTFDTAERNKKFHTFLARIEKMNITDSRVGTALCGK